MKKICLILIFTAGYLQLNSQVILQQSFNYSANITRVNPTSYKYFLMDVPAEQCRIYNLDFSLWKTIQFQVPEGEWLYDIRFVTEDLFDDDPGLELLYTTYKWITVNTNTGDGYYVYHSKIINEDGSVILDEPGALYSYVREISPGEFSLFLFIYDMSFEPYKIKTNIYSLPGQFNPVIESKKTSFFLSANPNPVKENFVIHYLIPPQTLEDVKLHITDSSGKEVITKQMDPYSNEVSFYGTDFTPGIYFYYLETNIEKSEVKKLIIAE